MKNVVILLGVNLLCWVNAAGAAISVGRGGSDLLTFDVLPTLADGWSTSPIPGSSSSLTDTASLDVAVQLLSASSIVNPLGETATVPPTVSTAGARWNSAGHYLQTRPGGVSYIVLMAALQNDTGSNVSHLSLSYDFAVTNCYYEVTNCTVTVWEDVPGHRVYFSLTGMPGSWQLIPELSTGAAGALACTLDLGLWLPDAVLYILWADDNGPVDGSGVLQEGSYAIDNFSVFPGRPSLTISRLGATQLELIWPWPAADFELQSAPGLQSLVWALVAAEDHPSNGWHHVIVDGSSDASFFRLEKR